MERTEAAAYRAFSNLKETVTEATDFRANDKDPRLSAEGAHDGGS